MTNRGIYYFSVRSFMFISAIFIFHYKKVIRTYVVYSYKIIACLLAGPSFGLASPFWFVTMSVLYGIRY